MSIAINAVRSTLPQSGRVAQVLPSSQLASRVAQTGTDLAKKAMLAKLQDGFEAPRSLTPTTSASAPARKKKKKHHGLFSKLGGLLKKALPMVSKLASFVPGLGAIAKPLEMATSLLSSQG